MAYITASTDSLKNACDHLSNSDVKIKALIASYGDCKLESHKEYYRELVRSIIGQQLSVKAAASINRRFNELFGGAFPDPETILKTSSEKLRSAGLSGAKAKYIRDLALHVYEDQLQFNNFENLSNEEIIRELIAVKGIGEWTAHMFLMFCMGRLDVLPVGDLGIRTAIMRLYELEKLPTPDEIDELATKNKWQPYESVACWYLWRSSDNALKS